MAEPIKIRLFPTWVAMSNLVVLGQTVLRRVSTNNFGALERVKTSVTTVNVVYLIEKLPISRCSKTAKIKLFINYKREMYALAHLNLSTVSFQCLS